jgi:hypothetical protein
MKRFSTGIVVAIFVVGFLTFMLGLLLNAFSGDIFGELSADHDSFSHSFVGHRALVELIERSGTPVVISRTPGLIMKEGRFPLLLLEPTACRDAEDGSSRGEELARLRRVLDFAHRTRTTVVLSLPKYRAVRSRERPGWIRYIRLIDPQEIVEMAWWEEVLPGKGVEDLSRHKKLNNVKSLAMETPRVDLGPDAQVLDPSCVESVILASNEGVLIGTIHASEDNPEFILLSDPGLFNNRGLATGDHAVLMHSLFNDHLDASTVIIDESVHGFTAENSVLARAFSFPVVLLVIHGLLTAGLLAWSASVRFGKELTPPPALPPGKVLLLGNTARLLLAAGSHGGAVRRYLRATMTDVADRFHFSEGTAPGDLLPRLESLSRTRGLPFDLKKIDKLSRSRNLTPGGAVKLSHRIHAWRRAIMESNSLKEVR